MKFKQNFRKEFNGWLWRLFFVKRNHHWIEFAYIHFGLKGICCGVEFPSTWHENKRGWIYLSLGLFSISISFPWKWTSIDDGSCSGHRYGFNFFSDLLFIYYGKSSSYCAKDKKIAFYMPWSWNHKEHKILSKPESYSFIYRLKSGVIQKRIATIQKESRLWKRFWIPYRKYKEYIDIQFNDEVGERSGSWKGGTLGMSYNMLPNETPNETLRRLENNCMEGLYKI